MQLHLQTWPDVERYLLRSQSIIIPIGSTEQHGPNGLIGTDALCAEAVARGVGEKADALVAPTISVGMAQHHLGFPGSMTLTPTTLIAVIKDWVFSLSRHGFRRFYFINGHGGNIATVTAAFSEIYTVSSMDGAGNQASLQCRLRNWWQADGISSLSRELYGSSEGSHATPSEVSHDLASLPRGGAAHAYGPRGGAERRIRRCRGLSPALPRRAHRLQSRPGHGRGRQAAARSGRGRTDGGLSALGRRLRCRLR